MKISQRSDFIIVNFVFYQDFFFKILINIFLKDVAECGGLLGLFLGLTFISIIEFIEHLINLYNSNRSVEKSHSNFMIDIDKYAENAKR